MKRAFVLVLSLLLLVLAAAPEAADKEHRQIMADIRMLQEQTQQLQLALGERRALAARAYLVQVGVSGDRLRTVSYGKEFPFDPGHDEAAWAKNRRAHFVITSK